MSERRAEFETYWTKQAAARASVLGEQHGHNLTVECKRPRVPQCRVVDRQGRVMSGWFSEQLLVKMLGFAISLGRCVRETQIEDEEASHA